MCSAVLRQEKGALNVEKKKKEILWNAFVLATLTLDTQLPYTHIPADIYVCIQR